MEFILHHALYFVVYYHPSQTVFREWSQIFRFITSQLSERSQIMYMSLLEFRMQMFRTRVDFKRLAKHWHDKNAFMNKAAVTDWKLGGYRVYHHI
jgi:hypothetical protein